ncbi:hypothetical protein Nepgr_029665 [Nepenthes gracilis]|uniref:Uncharacterized protein n=1 Tax=Nepenthes gracilis TaxID=150966 RepID=A0AAD3Y374_NEPGR|nr:hypothetical protein Nepgr_029665 [Nepenthes gracilis]
MFAFLSIGVGIGTGLAFPEQSQSGIMLEVEQKVAVNLSGTTMLRHLRELFILDLVNYMMATCETDVLFQKFSSPWTLELQFINCCISILVKLQQELGVWLVLDQVRVLWWKLQQGESSQLLSFSNWAMRGKNSTKIWNNCASDKLVLATFLLPHNCTFKVNLEPEIEKLKKKLAASTREHLNPHEVGIVGEDTGWDAKCACFLDDPAKTWSFKAHSKDFTAKYICALQKQQRGMVGGNMYVKTLCSICYKYLKPIQGDLQELWRLVTKLETMTMDFKLAVYCHIKVGHDHVKELLICKEPLLKEIMLKNKASNKRNPFSKCFKQRLARLGSLLWSALGCETKISAVLAALDCIGQFSW